MIGSGPYVIGKVDPGKSLTLKRNPELLGPRPADQSRPVEFRRGPFRFLSRCQFAFRGVQEGPLRRAGRSRSGPLGDRPTTSPPCATAASSRKPSPTACRRACPASSSTPAGRSSPTSACARRSALLFDFEWVNKNFFFGRYQRTASYFDGSELSARGIARRRARARAARALPRRGAAPTFWTAPGAAGQRRLRPRPRRRCARALALLKAAGYELRGTVLRNRAHAASRSPSRSWSRPRIRSGWRSPFRAICKRAGIALRVRVVDAVQYDRRRITYDFDMIQYRWDQSLSPGNEQAFYWGSAAADAQGTRNYMGVEKRGDRRHDRSAARGARTRRISSPRCARSTAC